VTLTLECLGRAEHFAARVTGADVTRGKPDPQVFHLAAEKLGIAPEQCLATGETFQDHGVLFRQLIEGVCDREIPGVFTFDSYFSSARSLNHIISRPRARPHYALGY